MKKFQRFYLGCAVMATLLIASVPALAQIQGSETSPFSKDFSDVQRSRRALFGGAAGFQNIDLRQLIAILIRALLSLLAILFLCLILYGGYVWMMARGNEEEVRRAKGIIRHSIIGLVVVLSSYAIGYFILYYLASSGTGPGAPLGV